MLLRTSVRYRSYRVCETHRSHLYLDTFGRVREVTLLNVGVETKQLSKKWLHQECT